MKGFPATSGLQVINSKGLVTYPYFGVNTETIWLVLVLLNLSCYLCHLASFTEVDEFRGVGQIVWVALLNV
jgi:hypothetical protein